MKTKKVIISILVFAVLSGAIFLINLFFGNPVSKMIAQKQTLKYYESTYKQKFVVYKSEYNPKIPTYVFEIGPENNEKIRFDTALYSQGISDVYGGIIASAKLAEDISLILKPQYGYLNYEITVEEDPLSAYAGEYPNYFETDPIARIMKNHQIVNITWKETGTDNNKIKEVISGMEKEIESKLPYNTPNLTVNFLNSGEDTKEKIFQNRLFLFPTFQ